MDNPKFTLWLEWEQCIEEPDRPFDLTNEMSNMLITLPDRRKYAYNVYTFKFVDTVRKMDRDQGDNLDGLFMHGPDLLVEDLKRSTLERVAKELIDTGRLYDSNLVPCYDDDDYQT